MELKDGSGHFGGDRAEEGALNDILFCFAVGNEQDLFCLHNSAHTHGDGLARDVAFFFKEACVCLDGGLVKINYVRCFFKDRSGLVEADMTVQTNAEQLQIDAAEGLDASIVVSALFCKVVGAAVGNKGVLAANVDMVKEIGLHKVAVALVVASVKTDVLVKVYRGYGRKIEVALFVPLDELTVGANRGRTGCKTKHALRLHNDLCRNDIGSLTAQLVVVLNGNEFHFGIFLSFNSCIKLLFTAAIGSGRGAHYTAKDGTKIILVEVAEQGGNLTHAHACLKLLGGVAHFHFGEVTRNAHSCIAGKDFFESRQTDVAQLCDLACRELLVQIGVQNAHDLGVAQSRREEWCFFGDAVFLFGDLQEPKLQADTCFVQECAVAGADTLCHGIANDCQLGLLGIIQLYHARAQRGNGGGKKGEIAHVRRASKLRPDAVELVGAVQKDLPTRKGMHFLACGDPDCSFGNEHQFIKRVTLSAKVVVFVKLTVKRAMKRQNIGGACNAAVVERCGVIFVRVFGCFQRFYVHFCISIHIWIYYNIIIAQHTDKVNRFCSIFIYFYTKK